MSLLFIGQVFKTNFRFFIGYDEAKTGTCNATGTNGTNATQLLSFHDVYFNLKNNL